MAERGIGRSEGPPEMYAGLGTRFAIAIVLLSAASCGGFRGGGLDGGDGGGPAVEGERDGAPPDPRDGGQREAGGADAPLAPGDDGPTRLDGRDGAEGPPGPPPADGARDALADTTTAPPPDGPPGCPGACCANADCPAMTGKTATCDMATRTCRYACNSGTTECNGSCVPASSVRAEICSNSVDDDCDGMVDCADSNCAPGTTCGTNQVCRNGMCGDCQAGGSCDPMMACKTGRYDCSTGTRRCVVAGNVTNGDSCGGDNACLDGVCRQCRNSGSCTNNQSSSCRQGQRRCRDGREVCEDGQAKDNGLPCGSNRVCFNGRCDPCTEGMDCSSGCERRSIRCATGEPRCTFDGTKDDGAPCGAARCTCAPRQPNDPPDLFRCGVDQPTCNSGMCDPQAVIQRMCPTGCNSAGNNCR